MRGSAGIGSLVLLVTLTAAAVGLVGWKQASLGEAAEEAEQAEPAETVRAAVARTREHRPKATAIGTILALLSITLRNELPGTVDEVMLTPGAIVEEGEVLVALDVSVEQAELQALQARAALAESVLERAQRLYARNAISEEEVDRARAERDIARAEISRVQAIIQRKTIRAPFRARVGLADVHAGQYLNEGTVLTTLQGVADAAHVDFAVAQHVAAALRPGDVVEVTVDGRVQPIDARIVAIDARVDRATRNAQVRARIDGANGYALAPGASVRVAVPAGAARPVVAIPASALRKGPAGDHVFVLARDPDGRHRASVRTVSSGPLLGDEVLIEEGLAAGELVAAAGSFKLQESVLVAIANERELALAGTPEPQQPPRLGRAF